MQQFKSYDKDWFANKASFKHNQYLAKGVVRLLLSVKLDFDEKPQLLYLLMHGQQLLLMGQESNQQ